MIKDILALIVTIILAPFIFIGTLIGVIVAGIMFGFISLILYPFIKLHTIVEKRMDKI